MSFYLSMGFEWVQISSIRGCHCTNSACEKLVNHNICNHCPLNQQSTPPPLPCGHHYHSYSHLERHCPDSLSLLLLPMEMCRCLLGALLTCYHCRYFFHHHHHYYHSGDQLVVNYNISFTNTMCLLLQIPPHHYAITTTTTSTTPT